MADTILGVALPGDSQPLDKKLPDRNALMRKVRAMLEARRDYEDRWKAIRDYQLPFVGDFEDTADRTNPGRRRDLKIAHGVTWQCCQIFAAGVMSGLTPPSRQWFRFAFKNPKLNLNVEAKKIADERQEIVATTLAKSNFYDSVHGCYMELPFGQAPLAVFYDPLNGIRFQQQTIGTYALDTDGYGHINVFARKLEMKLSQIIDCFGIEALPTSMQDMAKAQGNLKRKYKVYWIVCPNDKQMPGAAGSLDMPYLSAYWLDNSSPEEFLYVGGFEEWPVPTARYSVIGLEPYGRGPGWFAEGDAKMLQLLMKDYLVAVELAIKPPMQGPSNLMNNGGINLIPGGLTPVDSSSQEAVKPLFNVNLDLKAAAETVAATEERIKKAYSANLFLMLDNLDNSRMTAREVVERTQEKLQQLGPVVERLQNEFLSLIIQRVYNILERSNAFPEIPPEMQELLGEEELEVEYVSPLAQAQKMSGLVNIEQAIAQAGQMSQLWPESVYKIDAVKTLSEYFKLLGAPAIIERSDEDVEKILQQQQEAAAAQQEQMQAMGEAQTAELATKAAKNLTSAANDANPALTSWMGVPGGWD